MLGAATGHADAPATALSWTRMPGAERCIDAPVLARDVEARVGSVLVTPSHAELSIEGRIAPRAGGGWRAVVAVAHVGQPTSSQRTLETRSDDCRVLDAPIALVIALLIDPSGGPPTPPPAATPEVIVREVRVEVPVLVRDPWHVALAVRGDGELGSLPSLALGGSLAVLVEAPRLPLVELAASATPMQTVSSNLPGRTVDHSVIAGAIAACPARTVGAVRALACGGVRVARLSSAGHGFEQELASAILVPSLALDARIELRLGATFSLVAGAGLRAPLRDVKIAYERSAAAGGGDVIIWDASPVSLWLAVGVLARLL